MTHVVIMAGGIGSRFWPLSTPEYPKQFIDILGCGRSLIQLTVDRFKGICSDTNFWVVTNERYVSIVKEQVSEIPENHILAEPAARNTAPCIAWASWRIHQEDSDANIVVTPADALVLNTIEFQKIVKKSLGFTKDGNRIVTIGIKPNRPETGYGYVEIAKVAEVVNEKIHKVKEFKEKPTVDIAEKYVRSGNYLWNAGIFVWNVNTVISAIRRNASQIAGVIDKIISGGDVKVLFPSCDKISIDYAVIEPESLQGNVYTHPADVGWSDLGNWQSLHDKMQKDESNNAYIGNIGFYECKNCIVHTEDARKVVLQGLDGYIVSEKNGLLLVCKRSDEQRIKDF